MTAKGAAPAARRTWELASAQATRRLAARLGRLAPAGLVIALTGDLGSGKTTFVQGLAEGLEVPAGYVVTSPSFTLVNDYPGRLPLHHADLYRLGDGADIDEIGLLERMDGAGVLAIEWAERALADLPAAHLAVHLTVTGPDRRRAAMAAYGLVPANLLQRLPDPGRGQPSAAG